jgi:hypothetical protein
MVVLHCAVCGSPVVREAALGLGDEWVHADDEVTISGLRVQRSRYDHEARPDVIEATCSDG